MLANIDFTITIGDYSYTGSATYHPGYPAVHYLRNGDPGYPEEPPDCEFSTIFIEDEIGTQKVQFEDLDEPTQSRLREHVLLLGDELGQQPPEED